MPLCIYPGVHDFDIKYLYDIIRHVIDSWKGMSFKIGDKISYLMIKIIKSPIEDLVIAGQVKKAWITCTIIYSKQRFMPNEEHIQWYSA